MQSTVFHILESIPDAVVIVQKNGNIAYVNRQVENWFKYERKDLFGQPLEMLLPERFRSVHQDRRIQFAKAPIPRPMGTGLELYGRRKDGSEFPVDISIGPLEVGSETFMAGIIRDVTEQKKIETERNR